MNFVLKRNLRTIGILETAGYTPAMVALDAMEKGFQIRVLQSELNDMLGICIKILGDVDQVELALKTGVEIADSLNGSAVSKCLNRCDDLAYPVLDAPSEYNPLIQQDVVHQPRSPSPNQTSPVKPTGNQSKKQGALQVATDQIAALGFIETQGFTAVFEAIDTACKSANVEVVGKEKLGGGFVTVVIKGDVAAVKTAVASGSERVEALGKLIAAHVVTRPSEAVLSLLP